MAEQIGEAFVAVRADTTQFTSGMKGAAAAIGGIFGAVKVGQFLGSSLAEAKEAQKVGAQTAAVLKSTGGVANVTQGQIESLANSLSDMAGVDDELIQSSENVLLTFRDVRNEAGKGNDIFKQATKAILNMSTALGTDLNGATIAVGKALQDPVAGITALRRSGVQFTQSQKDLIKSLVESGDKLGAQKVILRELAQEFGGSAAAQATAGDKAKVAIDNLKESIGIALTPAVKVAAQAITALADGFNALPAPLRSAITVTTLLGGGLLAAGLAAEKFGGAFTLIKAGVSTAADAIGGAISLIRGFGVASALATGGIALAFAALAAGIVYIATASDKLGPGFDKAEAAGKRLGATTIAFAKGSSNEVATLEGKIKDLNAGINVLQKDLDKRTGGSVELQAESDAATSSALSLKQLTTERDALNKRLAEAKQAHAEEAAAIDATKGVMASYNSALATGATQTQALAAAGKAGQDAITGFQNALTAAAGGSLAYAAAQQNITKAQEDYNAAIAEFGPGSAEANAAQLALNQAQLAGVTAAESADQAQQTLIDSLASGNTTYKDQMGLLLQQLQLHPENAAGIQLEVDKLNAAKAAADAIPDSESVKVSTPGADDAIRTLGLVKLAADNISPFKTVEVRAANQLGFAAGGPIPRGGPFLVGERGPELITMGSSGYVTPNNKLGRAGVTIENAYFGDSNVLADLDYWAASRMAAGGI